MSLQLYSHPFASFCQKVLIALYENATPFEALVIDLADEAARASLVALWPVAKFPVLRDTKRGRTIPESTIIIEYLAQHYPGPCELPLADEYPITRAYLKRLCERPSYARVLREAEPFKPLFPQEK
jgi:glutathione S-transferase